MFVTPEQLVEYTGKRRPSAQARFIADRGLKFDVRDDGSIALRQEELDRHTLSKPELAGQRRRPLDLSLFRKAG